MNVGGLRHWVTLTGPGVMTPDGQGGYTIARTPLEPARVKAEIRQATVRELERVTAGAVVSSATHIVTMRFHPQVTMQTEIAFENTALSVTGINDVEKRHRELILTCEEVVA
jgi:head-tail adaptor